MYYVYTLIRLMLFLLSKRNSTWVININSMCTVCDAEHVYRPTYHSVYTQHTLNYVYNYTFS